MGDLHAAELLLAADGAGAEQPLADLLGALNEAANQVTGHEQHLELVVVLVVASPDGPAVGVVHLEEGVHGLVVVGAVGVHLLPGVHGERSRGRLVQQLERVLGLYEVE